MLPTFGALKAFSAATTSLLLRRQALLDSALRRSGDAWEEGAWGARRAWRA